MTTWRAATLVLLLACSSTATRSPDGAPPADAQPDLIAPDAPSPDVLADAPVPADLSPDLAADAPPDLALTPDLLPPDAQTCAVPPDTFGPFSGCAPGGAQACDPVCQARCGCGERCTLEGGAAVCRNQAGPFQALGQTCDPKADVCRPGTICLQESLDHPACGAHCYRHCRADADCAGGAKCAIEVQFGVSTTTSRVCTAPAEGCDPYGAARCLNVGQRPYPTFGCYLMSSDQTNLTICDCAGTVAIGMACTYQHQCVPGAECVLDGNARLCRKVCSVELVVGPNPAPCALNQVCTPFPGSTKYGYCH
jgi:hypothetical protein